MLVAPSEVSTFSHYCFQTYPSSNYVDGLHFVTSCIPQLIDYVMNPFVALLVSNLGLRLEERSKFVGNEPEVAIRY